ncbi:MAG: tRNA (adenosine(37)-N6)-dimethylallyltransferase MiaA [Atopobiaceae bacterium]|jgi:tRNA dimethylallyltransferase|nr:tRNA (adenosine(37)-N6)-dimethylallyltransferase MiaA [Atopobiaceae bacterium]MCI1317889.1 tRNA (adenosine(37)-N6)-dimethylallyltransferase MiaA [Atopobiaceae bacterium]MCI1388398.1 tRNA (adenosine(37)-N6)-dimethylallyltransferase MiaA [Atopobiaceae bacterium]MCI1431351.1 tRNA (adenosine(37)-N6)-dimethylallyltransferase MiaA [Atopobiaceae bacterium]MCI1469787.1 tRNA (adenosine(37)-N6)-dimethylallyltransferase MiaA [Atopobiaceae bacterium]
MTRLCCIVGPTAAGKSALADEVAVRLGTTVISVDAMQVYRGMDIGTAKTPPAERRCELEMVDVCDPSEGYSARLYQAAARSCVDRALKEGRVPVLCGGTGLYLDAVIDEMDFPAGEKGSRVRSAYEALVAEKGPAAAWELLSSRDPASAALIHPNNSRRVVRALEMGDEGRSYAEQASGLHDHVPRYAADLWGVTMSRERLYARIDERVDAMFAAGLVDEVRGLVAGGLSPESTAGQAIGYKEVIEALEGDVSMEDAREAVKVRSRHYAKRQLSWFRRDGRVRWLDMDELSFDEAARIVEARAREGSGDGRRA